MNKTIYLTFLLILFGALLASCSSGARIQLTQTPAARSTLSTPLPSETPAPSPTPQATKVLLVAPSGANTQAVQAILVELSAKAGLILDIRQTIQNTDLTQEVKLVVLLTAPVNLTELLSTAPQAQFVVVAGEAIPTAKNLTTIRYNAENQAFIAGFTSVLLSTDYRGAGLLPTDGPLGAGLKEAFVNGGHYFCGVCSPVWPLNGSYPVTADQPTAVDGPTWQTAAASLFDNQKAEIYFLSPESIRPEVVSYLQGKIQADKTITLLGETAPPEALKSQWAVSIHFDIPAALRQVWPEVISGKGGAALDAPLMVDNVNPDLLSEGRMRLVKDLIEQLKTGKVSSISIPVQ